MVPSDAMPPDRGGGPDRDSPELLWRRLELELPTVPHIASIFAPKQLD